MYKLPERRGGGVIWAMPERKHSFFQEVFPKFSIQKLSANRGRGGGGIPLKIGPVFLGKTILAQKILFGGQFEGCFGKNRLSRPRGAPNGQIP